MTIESRLDVLRYAIGHLPPVQFGDRVQPYAEAIEAVLVAWDNGEFADENRVDVMVEVANTYKQKRKDTWVIEK